MQLTTQNFSSEVLQSPTPVLVDFWASWCGPCKTMSPVVEELGRELTGMKICKVNVDEYPALAQQYNILSIPTFIIFKNGRVVDQFSGVQQKKALCERIERCM